MQKNLALAKTHEFTKKPDLVAFYIVQPGYGIEAVLITLHPGIEFCIRRQNHEKCQYSAGRWKSCPS